MRYFIAIDLPQHIKSALFRKFQQLQEKRLFNGKFVEKDNLHLTLRFLGETTEDKANEIEKKLENINFGVFECNLGKAGFFDEKIIKVLWVELLSDKIEKLYHKISKILPEFAEDRKFNSHITVARVKNIIEKERMLEEMKKINFKKEKFDVKEIVLMKSELFSGGPRYKILKKFKL